MMIEPLPKFLANAAQGEECEVLHQVKLDEED